MNMDNLEKDIDEVTSNILKLSETVMSHSTPKVGINSAARLKISERQSRDSGISSATQTEINMNDSNDTVLLPGQVPKQIKSQKNYGSNITLPLDNPVHKAHDKFTDQSKFAVKFKPATYDGSGSWLDYKSHFEMVSIVNDWNYTQKGLYLAVSLRGQAQAILGDLPPDMKSDYETLLCALEERFAPPSQTELYRAQFREKRQKSSETLPELGQAIRRLANLAYPTAPRDVRETLAKEQFIDGLVDSDMRLRIKQSRPKTLNDAVKLAVELEAFNRAERQNNVNRGHLRNTGCSDIKDEEKVNTITDDNLVLKSMAEAIQTLTSEVTKLKELSNTRAHHQHPFEKRSRNYRNKREFGSRNRDITCFNCGEKGHIQYKCNKPKPDKCDIPETDYTIGSEKTPKSRPIYNKKFINRKKNPSVSILEEAGMYIKLQIQNTPAMFLIDTGATMTLVSSKLYDKFSQKPSLKSVTQTIETANGGNMHVHGRAEFEIKIGSVNVSSSAVVANITAEGIIGLDFLRTNNCILDIVSETLTIGQDKFKLIFEGPLGCYRICASETVNMPPNSELIVTGKICVPTNRKLRKFEGLIEPSENSKNSEKPLTARCLVQTEEFVPVRLMNLSSESKVIYIGTTIAQISEISEVTQALTSVAKVRNIQETSLRPDLKDLLDRTSKHLNKDQARIIRDLLGKHEKLFAASDSDLGRTNIVKHSIRTDNSPPIKEPPRRTPFHLNNEIDKNIDEMLAKGIIEPSNSPWASGVVLVRKKDNSFRFCVDYRKLNKATIKDAYPLPRIDDSLDQLAGNVWWSTLDLCAGYWQVELNPEDKYKTAFATRRGLFQFKVMPFGLCCAPSTFERLMETVLAGLQWDICLVYLDDIIVTGKTFEDMIGNLGKVFGRLEQAGLKLKAKKCCLCAKEVTFLGHVISEKGIATDPSKIAAVKQWPVPSNVTELRSFIGLCSYYRRYIKDFSKIAKCLHSLTEKGKSFIWTKQCQEAFEKLKRCLISAPILAHPDFTKSFILDTDASNEAIGAILSQVDDQGKEHVIAYASRTLSKAERRYCVTRKELLAVVHFSKHFKHYLYGRQFLLRTDHSSLRWLMRFKNPDGQLARWLEVLSEYDMKIEHRPGRQHQNADALSRLPCKQCGFHEDWEKEESNIPKVQVVGASIKTENNHQYIKNDDPITIAELQDGDSDISCVKTWLVEKSRPPYHNVSSQSWVVKALWSQWTSLTVKDNILYRKYQEKNEGVLQAVIPFSERRKVLFLCHDNKTAGHFGIRKTLAKIRQRFYWPGLQSDVRKYVTGCEKCSKRKHPNKTKRAPMQIFGSGSPMERIATDIMGELPETADGNKYILVVSDYFSKWTESFAMPNIEAKTVARIIVEEVVARFGVPAYIHSDQGRQFESQLFSEVCMILGIKKTRTCPYNPQSDGMVERFNQTLEKMLSVYVEEHQKDWDRFLPYVMMAYRSSEHETTGYTPNFLMLGREVSTPLDIMYEMPPSVKHIPQHKWVWELKERMENAHTLVRQNTQNSMMRQKRYHDLKLFWQSFEPGEEVYVYFPVRKSGCSAKFTSFWRGPFKVIRKCSDVTYEVKCGPRGKPQIIHVDRMKKCVNQKLHGESDMEQKDSELQEHNSNDVDDRKERNTSPEMDSEVHFPERYLEAEEPEIRPRRERRQPYWLKDYDTGD